MTDDKALALEPGEPDEPIFDERMRKALAQAPDRAVLPDWRIRQAILDHAHDAIAASEELLAASRESTPWWRLAWWRERVGPMGAATWGAAFATVAAAVLATVMWQHGPALGPRPAERPAAPGTVPAPDPARVARDEAARKEPERATPAAAPKAAAAAPSPSQLPIEALLPPVLLNNAPPAAPPPPPPAPAPAAPPAPTASNDAGVRQAPPPPGAVPVRPAPPPAAAADAAAAPQRRAQAEAPPAPPAQPAEDRKRSAAVARPDVAPEPAAPAAAVPQIPDFASLSRWTEMRVANVNGEVRVVPRAEAGELSLLMSSAAIMATGATPLRSLPEWRVSLERKGQVLAVLEVARTQVRWTEGKLPPSTGTPPVESIDALRGALRESVKAGPTPRPQAPMPPVRAPRAEPREAPARSVPAMPEPSLLPPPAPQQ